MKVYWVWKAILIVMQEKQSKQKSKIKLFKGTEKKKKATKKWNEDNSKVFQPLGKFSKLLKQENNFNRKNLRKYLPFHSLPRYNLYLQWKRILWRKLNVKKFWANKWKIQLKVSFMLMQTKHNEMFTQQNNIFFFFANQQPIKTYQEGWNW